MLNLYQLHSEPQKLKGYDQAHEKIPEFVWKRYKDQPKQLKKREHVLAQNSWYAYQYARHVLKGRFPKGEHVLAQDPRWAYSYAIDVLNDRFPKGEDAIKQNQNLWELYKDRFWNR